MNDPFTGGLSSYGLILMVAFALLRRDHFPPSPAGPCIVDRDLVKRCHSDSTPSVLHGHGDSEETDKSSKDVDAPGAYPSYPSPPESQSAVEMFTSPAPPSPGHEETFPSSCYILSPAKSEASIAPVNKRAVASVGRQRGFWQPSSLAEHGANSWVTGESGARRRSKLDKAPMPTEGKSRMLWDRYEGHTLLVYMLQWGKKQGALDRSRDSEIPRNGFRTSYRATGLIERKWQRTSPH